MEIACTLGADQVAGRVAAWRDVVALAGERVEVDGGVRLEFGPVAKAPVADIARLAQAEQGCCAFFSFTLTMDERGAGLEVRAPAEAAAVVAELLGPNGP